MADIRQAIEYAKKDPESAFAKELRKRIESGQMDKELVSAGLKPMKQEEMSFADKVTQKFGSRVQKAEEAQAKTVAGEQGLISGTLQTLGQGAGFVGDVVTEGIKSVTPNIIEKPITKGIEKVGETIAQTETAQKFAEWAKLHPEASSNLGSIIDLASLIPIAKGAKAVTELTETGIRKGAEKVVDIAKQIPEKAKQALQAPKEKLVDFIAPEADDFTKTILKRTTPDEVDNFVKIQEKASVDPEALTPYEVVGDKIADATKKLEELKGQIGAKKAQFVEPLRGGFESFDVKPFLVDIMSLKNKTPNELKGFVQGILDEAKNLKTKVGVDKFIDNVQDKIYRSGKDLTLPKGSALEKQLRGIVGKMNNELKKSLPEEYSLLNKQFSDLQKATTALNTALGETIEGVATRGSSLVKQFFSPSGRKAKELFDFIKTNTGIDLAKDATLARYVMELFDDPRSRTLLGGEIPTSITGVINKLVDFGVEKTGAGKKLQESVRKGAVKKAKKLTTTNPKKLTE